MRLIHEGFIETTLRTMLLRRCHDRMRRAAAASQGKRSRSRGAAEDDNSAREANAGRSRSGMYVQERNEQKGKATKNKILNTRAL